ncbi:hypothetical protein ACGC1H_005812 [Rhizoctonia solani]
MGMSSHPQGNRGFESKLRSLCRSLIELALELWREAQIRTAEDYLATMRALIHIDEILKYACSPGTIHLMGLKNRLRLLRQEIDQRRLTNGIMFHIDCDLLAALNEIGDTNVSGLGRKAIPISSIPVGDSVDMYIHTASELPDPGPSAGPGPIPALGLGLGSGLSLTRRGSDSALSLSPADLGLVRRSGFSCAVVLLHRREPDESSGGDTRLLLDAYIHQLSVQVGILNTPTIWRSGFEQKFGTFLRKLGLERPAYLPSHGSHGLIGTHPRVHISMAFDPNFKLYSVMKHVREQDIIFRDRYGYMCSSSRIWENYNLPSRLHWSLYQLKMNRKEELGTLALVPVEPTLTREQITMERPAEPSQTLLSTWQRIMELEGQSKNDLCIGWLIEVNEFVGSPAASSYAELASEGELCPLSEKLECTLYPRYPLLITYSHSVLGNVNHGQLDYTTAMERGCPREYFVKAIRSIQIDHGQIDSLKDLNGSHVTRLLRRWCKYNHPNVLPLVGIQEMPCSGIGLVLPETNTKNLAEYLAATPDADRCKLCGQVASGLAYLHGVGVVHGSLRAANILVSLTGEAIVSDPLLLQESRGNNTYAGVAWLAPEVIDGERLTQASDVYSLGMSLQEVINGVLPDPQGDSSKALDVESYNLRYVFPTRPEKSIPANSKDGDDLWTLLSECCSANPSSRPITDWVAELMKSITQGGLQQLHIRQESENDPCFESRAFQEESLELSDVESVLSSSSGASFSGTNKNGLSLSNSNANGPGLLGPESRMMARKILKQLATHGCENLTDHIDWDSFSAFPFCQGGFGDVYRGKLLSGLQVAVKNPHVSLNILEENPDYLTDVAREIHSWKKCDHPNVLHFLGLAEFRGQIGMVAPWMEKGSLPYYLEKTFDADRCKLCAQICEGTAYLHEIGIVHGDLKGENVLISSEGVAVVTDLGASLLKNRSLKIVPLERGLCFSIRWAAPELLDGDQEGVNTKESDVYALGMVCTSF